MGIVVHDSRKAELKHMKQIALKLKNAGMTKKDYTLFRAKAILNMGILPRWNIITLENNCETIKKML